MSSVNAVTLDFFLFYKLQIDSVTLENAQEFLFHITLLETAASAYRVYGVDIFGTLSLLAALQGDIQLNFKIHCSYCKHLYTIENIVYC